MEPTPQELTPAQERTLALLRRSEHPVRFEAAEIDQLITEMRDACEQFAARLGADHELWVSKHELTRFLGCERFAMIEDPFRWSAAVAGGQVAHRAIQLGLNWRADPVPSVLVDEALDRIANEDRSLGGWLRTRDAGDLADVRGLAVERVTKFFESFPPLDPRARPMVEARLQWPLDGPVVLAGKVDLVLGRPVGRESRKVIIDLKTGQRRAVHREDLRFYALIETLRSEVPPRKLASFYLDAGQADVEDVTVGVLRAALRRTIDGIDAMVSLRVEGRTPVERVGPTCRWCPISSDCEVGRAYLEDRETFADEGLDGEPLIPVR